MNYEKKCPQCELVNISRSPVITCAGCQAPLYTVGVLGAPLNPKLENCEDCHIPISREAESCPYCGRFYRHLRPREAERSRWWWAGTILMALFAFAFVTYWTWVAVMMLVGNG